MIAGSARRQIAINIFFTVTKAVSLMVSIWIADLYLSAAGMGFLLLFRRQGALWGNILQLGFSQCLQKFYTEEAEAVKRNILWGTLNRWVFIACFAGVFFSFVFAGQLSELLFGSTQVVFSWTFGLYTCGLALGFMACSSWMAEFRFVEANLVDWLNGSLVFIVCVMLLGKTSEVQIVLLLGFLTLLVSAGALLMFSFRYTGVLALSEKKFKLDRRVIKFGATRSISSFLDMGILVIGPWMLRDTPQQAGYLLISFNVLRLAQTLVMPVAQVLALRSNSHRCDHAEEVRNILRLSFLSVVGACLAVAVYFFCGEFALTLWLPNSAGEVALILDHLIWFVPAFCLFYSLRNFIDLNYLFPWNMVILSAAILGFVVIYYGSFLHGIEAVLIGTQVMLGSVFLFYAISFVYIYIQFHYGRQDFD